MLDHKDFQLYCLKTALLHQGARDNKYRGASWAKFYLHNDLPKEVSNPEQAIGLSVPLPKATGLECG